MKMTGLGHRTIASVALLAVAVAVASCSGSDTHVSAATAGSAQSGEAHRSTSQPGPAPTDAQSALLARLRADLDAVASAPGSVENRRGGQVDVTPLAGVSHGQIRAALGEPHTCTENVVTDPSGHRRPVAPCESNDDWFYSFYKLPADSLGGGPELLLTFDAHGAVARADWRFTQ